MLKFILAISFFVGLSTPFSYKRFAHSLLGAVAYLEDNDGPNQYLGIHGASIGVAQLMMILNSELYMSKKTRNQVEKLYIRINKMVQNTLPQIESDARRIKNIPSNYLVDYDFDFSVHAIPNMGVLPINSEMIYKYSHYSRFESHCISDVEVNEDHDGPRTCQIRQECLDYMEKPYMGLIENRTVDARFDFLDSERIFNCTNTPRDKRDELLTIACTFMLRQVNTIIANKYNLDLVMIFFDKVLNCAAHGFGEFLGDYIIDYILWMQRDNDGGFGSYNYDDYAVNILTSSAVGILASGMRLALQSFSMPPPSSPPM